MLINFEKTFRFQRFILIAGRPCMGKTTIASKLAKEISDGEVGFFDVEKCQTKQQFEEQLSCVTEKELVVVDTLQRLRDHMKEYDEAFVLNSFKRLIDQKGCSVIVTSELSREVEERISNIPRISDLKGKVESTDDFDFIGFLYRDGYYNPGGCTDTHLIFRDRNDKTTFVLDCKNEEISGGIQNV